MKHLFLLIALIACSLPLHAQPATQPETHPSTQPATQPTVLGPMVPTRTIRVARQVTPSARDIANRHGLAAWPTVTQLDFTFNVKTPQREITRKWSWRPHDNQVTRTINNQPLIFDPTTVTTDSPGPVIAAHKEFINDTYWLLFPFQLVWSNPTLNHLGSTRALIANTPVTRIDITYPTGGYTPGDTYRLYLNPDLTIAEWTFARPDKPERHFAFNDPVILGPLVTYLNHPTKSRTVNVFFTNLSLQTTDANTPLKPIPLSTD
ncbi:MAG: hypothetical protein AAF750_17920 [Planctomycetota bacterium]